MLDSKDCLELQPDAVRLCTNSLTKIAILAEQIDRYYPEILQRIAVEESGSESDLAAKLACTQGSLAKQIGWLADKVNVTLGGEGFKDDTEEWLI